jgi:type II pantothenate kinase
MKSTFVSSEGGSGALTPVLVAFVAGVGTTILAYQLFLVGQANAESDFDESQDGEPQPRSELLSTSSTNGVRPSDWKRSERASFYEMTTSAATGFIRDIQSSIGELPRRRTAWPWQRRRRSRSVSPERDTTSNLTGSSSASSGSVVNNTIDHSSSDPDLCIGSIFGMDIGGTLAKLVYFEGGPPESPEEVSTVDSFAKRSKSFASSNSSSSSVNTLLHANRTASDHIVEVSDAVVDDSARESNTEVFRKKLLKNHLHTSIDWTPVIGSNLLTSRDETIPRASAVSMKGEKIRESDVTDRRRPSVAHRASQRSLPEQLHLMVEQLQCFDELTSNYERGVAPGLAEKNRIKRAPPVPKSPLRAVSSVLEYSSTANSPTDTKTPHEDPDTTILETSPVQRSRSMLELAKSKDHAEALDRFYLFAQKLDSHMQEGVRDKELSFYSRELGGSFHFIRFQTRHMGRAMDLIRSNDLHQDIQEMGVTGGGAHKFADVFRSELGIEIRKEDELDSLVAGMQFVLSTVVGECYTFRPEDRYQDFVMADVRQSVRDATSVRSSRKFQGDPIDFFPKTAQRDEDRGKGDEWWWSRKVQRDAISYSSTYPYLLVTIGTGVSILRVDGPRKHERISGSTIGGGTYFGLIRLLTDCEDYDDVMKLAERGDPSKVDMMVGDIYGANNDALEKIGLPSNLVASSFGKLVAKEDPAADLKEEDLARALLLMVTNNIGQVAFLNAKLHGTKRIYFVGNFLRQNRLSQSRLSYAINYWSKGEMEALFLEHEGYFGALGAFIINQGVSSSVQGKGAEPISNPVPLAHRRAFTVSAFTR